MNLKMLKAAFAGLIFTVSGFANAGLIDVSYIEITNAKGDWLQVAEVVANDMFGNDVALVGSAVASATSQWAAVTGPEKVIDGNTSGNGNLEEIFHEKTKGSTLTIAFNSLQELASVQIFGRTDCCTVRDLYSINFFGKNNDLLATASNLDPGFTFITPDTSTSVPEPSTLAIFALGVMGLAARRSSLVTKR